MGGPAAELLLLGGAVVVGLVQFFWATLAARAAQKDMKWAAGPRDDARPISGGAARLDRSYRNFLETFPLHAAAVICAYLAARLGDLTLWGSALYVAGRALHPIFYLLAVPYARTIVWLAAFAGTVMVTTAIFL